MEKKFSKLLTSILIIISVSVFVIIGFCAYNFFQKVYVENKADHAIDDFDEKISELEDDGNTEENSEEDNEEDDESDEDDDDDEGNGGRRSSNRVDYSYDGYDVVGKIEIPRTGIKYPIFDVATLSSMKISVGIVYGPGLNEVGNTIIMGHNFRNGTFFSNNNRIRIGDSIYITDAYGWRLRYSVYEKYETSPDDFDYATRNTYGRREISLASCTSDSKSRLIIWARAR